MVLLADCPAASPRLAAVWLTGACIAAVSLGVDWWAVAWLAGAWLTDIAWGCDLSPPCENHDLIIFNPYIDREKPFYETVLTGFQGLAWLNHPTIGEDLAS